MKGRVKTPSVLLYDPEKRLTLPLNQPPPRSTILQRFIQAFQCANENNVSRFRHRKRPSALNFTSAANERNLHSGRYDEEGTPQCDILSEERSIASSSEGKRWGEPKMRRKVYGPSAKRRKHENDDVRNTTASTSSKGGEEASYTASCSGRDGSTSSSVQLYGSGRDPLSIIQQSLPRFLSDITVPTSESYAEEGHQQERGSTPFPTPLFPLSSPTSKFKASATHPNSTFRDNIWFRQEGRYGCSIGASPTYRFRAGHHDASRLGHVVTPLGARVGQPAQEAVNTVFVKLEKGEEGSYENDDCSSSDLVHDCHNSPDWLGASNEGRHLNSLGDLPSEIRSRFSWQVDDGRGESYPGANIRHSNTALSDISQ
ncbi:hypothetical protein CBS101457_001287 [Exobasidium rhododendri]|nr:hypothetical protein CBS101457_001287 [Exobasidium rhododendri]